MNGGQPYIAVRPATTSDVEEILRLGAHMYASVGASVDDAWRELGRSQFETRLGSDLLGWVVDAPVASDPEDGALAACGFVNLTPRLPLPSATTAIRGYIQWVVTDERHQRRGLGRAIMSTIIDWADGEGLDVLDLNSSPTARSLYLSLGFRYSPDIEYPLSVLGAPMQRRRR